MRLLSKEDILKNKVDTIEQFYILRYLKDNLNTDNFDLYLLNRNKIKVIDKYNDILYFEYDKQNKKVIYNDYDANNEYFSTRMNVSKRTITNALKKLKDNNLVIIKVINYKRTIYLSNEVRNKLLDV